MKRNRQAGETRIDADNPGVPPGAVKILHRDSLPRGGFAGLRERRLVMDPRLVGHRGKVPEWRGLGSMVYLADASFRPHGETRYHTHRGIDVITLVVHGRIAHRGSLGDGTTLDEGHAQVQYSGHCGFGHNEINPDPTENRALQMWMLPRLSRKPPRYTTVRLEPGKVTRIFDDAAAGEGVVSTAVDVGLLCAGEGLVCGGQFLAYVAVGNGVLNNTRVAEGDLIRGTDLAFSAEAPVNLVLVRVQEGSTPVPRAEVASVLRP